MGTYSTRYYTMAPGHILHCAPFNKKYSWAEFDSRQHEAAASCTEYIWNVEWNEFNNLDIVKTLMCEDFYERQQSILALAFNWLDETQTGNH